MAENKTIILTSAMVTAATGYVAGVQRGEELPTARFLIGLGVAFTVISIINDLGSPLGAAFALLIMIAALLSQGEDVIKYVRRRSTTKTAIPTTNRKGKTGQKGTKKNG